MLGTLPVERVGGKSFGDPGQFLFVEPGREDEPLAEEQPAKKFRPVRDHGVLGKARLMEANRDIEGQQGCGRAAVGQVGQQLLNQLSFKLLAAGQDEVGGLFGVQEGLLQPDCSVILRKRSGLSTT